MNLSTLADIAITAAKAAGAAINRYADLEVPVEHKEGGDSYASQVVTAVDKESESIILNHLLPTCEEFDIALLSEETADDGSRFEKDCFWCIDPIDGTLPFIRKVPGFCVSIALVSKGAHPLIGVVYDPSTEILYHAINEQGAFRNEQPWEISPKNTYLTYVSDKTLADTPRADEIRELLEGYRQQLGLSEIREISGSGAVLAAIRVLEHGPACMLKFPKPQQGGGSIWDYAATACIYQELHLPATNLAGGPLDLNRPDDSFMNHEGVWFGTFTR